MRILVTRPAGQAQRLCDLIQSAGHESVCLPAIEIHPPVDPYRLEAVADSLDDYDLAIFVSVNAVRMALEGILDQRDWPAHTRIATVGVRSAEALAAYGLSVDLVPEHRYSSEALLALEELEDLTGRNVVIFRGNGGREVLHDTLRERGAEVEYVEVYRRLCPTVVAGQLLPLLRPGYLDYITITSNEALQNLFTMAGSDGQSALQEIQLVVVGDRQARLAAELGFNRTPLVAAHASDAALMDVLQQHWAI